MAPAHPEGLLHTLFASDSAFLAAFCPLPFAVLFDIHTSFSSLPFSFLLQNPAERRDFVDGLKLCLSHFLN